MIAIIIIKVEDEENGYSHQEVLNCHKELHLDMDELEWSYDYDLEEREQLAYDKAMGMVAMYPTCFREGHTVIQIECVGFDSAFGGADGSYWELL